MVDTGIEGADKVYYYEHKGKVLKTLKPQGFKMLKTNLVSDKVNLYKDYYVEETFSYQDKSVVAIEYWHFI